MSPFSPPDMIDCERASYSRLRLVPPFGCAMPDNTSADRGGHSVSANHTEAFECVWEGGGDMVKG